MTSNNSFLIQNSFIDENNFIVAHLYDSSSGFSPNLEIIQSDSQENYGLIEYVRINNKDVLDRKLIIFMNEKNFFDYRIMFLVGAVWKLEFSFKDDLLIDDFFRIEDACKIPIIKFSFSYKPTHHLLREVSVELKSFKTQISKIQDELSVLKNVIYILGGIALLIFFMR